MGFCAVLWYHNHVNWYQAFLLLYVFHQGAGESLRKRLYVHTYSDSAGLCKGRSLFVKNKLGMHNCLIFKLLLSFLAFLWPKSGEETGRSNFFWYTESDLELVGRNCAMAVVIYSPLLFLCFSSLKRWLLMLLSLQNHSSTWISSTWISIKSSRNRKHL